MEVNDLVKHVAEKRAGFSFKGRAFADEPELVLAIGLCAEAGELASAVRGEYFYGKERGGLSDGSSLPNEIADVFVFLAAICDRCGVDLEEVVFNKLKMNEERFGKKE